MCILPQRTGNKPSRRAFDFANLLPGFKDDSIVLTRCQPELAAWRDAMFTHHWLMTTLNEKLDHRATLEAAYTALKRAYAAAVAKHGLLEFAA